MFFCDVISQARSWKDVPHGIAFCWCCVCKKLLEDEQQEIVGQREKTDREGGRERERKSKKKKRSKKFNDSTI